MKLNPETIQQLAAHRIKPLGAPERTMKRAQRLVMVKVGKGKTVPVALRETTAFVARETDG
ncbi:MAG: hypothetical protein CL539_06115 [Alcanivorax sp.]|jgi:hypothetical protein|uniref:hypothetical protein n=1 Tax=unclassified Alcanivorax TaxID=2638842 RepID=UPI000C91089D|nr:MULTISPECIES: hypothetical protein [unclassified Alcanivorax]MAC14240.1 hypothetical protein [Alcanivorax sp.]|tara:strand:+ start:10652 stop:10834 length:183 start_codon:yes stop_codon:yes gene_type:complete